MTDRTIQQGDTWPPLKGAARDARGLVNLSLAETLQVVLRGPWVSGHGDEVLSGTPTIIDPPELDEDGVTELNWRYELQPGDTDIPGVYEVRLVATWGPGERQTFPNGAAPVLRIER